MSLLLPELAEWLPELPPHIVLEPEQERMRLLEALTRTVLALGQISPHLLILEDLQWTDKATLEALIHLTRHLRQSRGAGAESRLLVIGSYRSEEARERAAVWQALQALDQVGSCERLELSPLTAEETGALVRRGLGLTRKAPRFEARLYRETEGNPLFVLETLRALHDEGLLYRDPSGEWSTPWDEMTTDYAELPLPAGVYQVIAQRLARLGPGERATLNAAAVLGADFDFRLLIQAGGLDQETGLAAVSELVRRRFLEEGPTAYRFSHDKVRQVTYMEISEAERRRLHRQASEALEALHPEQVEALAYHFTRGQVSEKGIVYSLRAGDQAKAVYANQTALIHYEQALSLVDNEDLATQWEIHRRWEEVLDILGQRNEQATGLAEMMRLAVALGDENRRAVTLYRQGHLKVRTGAPREGLTLLREGTDIARKRGDYSLAGKCYIMMGRAHWHLGDAPRCLAAAEEAQSLFQQAGDRSGEAGALNLMGNLRLCPGQQLPGPGELRRRPVRCRTRPGPLLRLGESKRARHLSAESVSIIEGLGPDICFLEIVYVHHYQILARLEGTEAAQPYLARAYEVVTATAGTIHDPELRRSFLEDVRENREIIAAYEAWQAGVQPVRVRLPRADAPSGRPLRDDEWVEVTWTVTTSEDEAISGKACPERSRRTARRQHRLLCLLREAQEQGAAPTVEDLAEALGVSRATVKRDLAGLRKAGRQVRTRGGRSAEQVECQ